MGATSPNDADALRATTGLVDFLCDLTSESERDRIRDITSTSHRSPNPVLWLAELPDGVRLSPDRGDTLLEVDPVARTAPPRPPEILTAWLSGEVSVLSPEPALAATGPIAVEVTASDGSSARETRHVSLADAGEVRRAYERWLPDWRRWAAREQRARRDREFYESLERVANVLEQQDDEYEFVLATGLITWLAPDDTVIRRHLVTTPARVTVTSRSARISVVREAEGPLQLEDRELFEGQAVYRPERGRERREAVQHGEQDMLSDEFFDTLCSWFEVSIDSAMEVRSQWEPPSDTSTSVVCLTAAPALLLRPRNKALLAEAYRRIAAALREPDVRIPIGLANMVADIDPVRRDQWLAAQGATGGDVLGDDPLFPLPANDEQSRILDRLRTETNVVVQGPPGTGKTHTIANLISALLARGQRVLVTSEKEQALRVLRTKVPEELRPLCVLLAGSSRGGSEELQRGIEALSGLAATTDVGGLGDRARRFTSERDALRARGAELAEQIRALREAETYQHPPVVPGYRDDMYRGILVEIVRAVGGTAAQHDWMPPLPAGVPDRPPLSPAEFAELHTLLRNCTAEIRTRAEQLRATGK